MGDQAIYCEPLSATAATGSSKLLNTMCSRLQSHTVQPRVDLFIASLYSQPIETHVRGSTVTDHLLLVGLFGLPKNLH
jgi:hypothetical protein